jgi:hypothetical protein
MFRRFYDRSHPDLSDMSHAGGDRHRIIAVPAIEARANSVLLQQNEHATPVTNTRSF